MSNQADHTIVRLRVPPDLKIKIEKSAERNNRSQSAEMVSRLDDSFLDEIVAKETINRRNAGCDFASGALTYQLAILNEMLTSGSTPEEKQILKIKIEYTEELLELFQNMKEFNNKNPAEYDV